MQNYNKEDLKKQFSVLYLPSGGRYYKNKNKYLLIRYLTAVEEHILCDSLLMESGIGIELVLKSLIIDDIDIKDLLLSDYQAILIYLRSTSYGDSIEANVKCPNCSKEFEHFIKLSELQFKEPLLEPNEEGKYLLYIEEFDLKILICPLTLRKEMEKNQNNIDKNFFFIKDDEGVTKIKKEKTLSLVYNIESINEITDKEKIGDIVRKLPKKYIDEINIFIENNQVGINEKIKIECPFCSNAFEQKFLVGYNFLSLPLNYKDNIYEEIFLITYYGKSIGIIDAESLTVNQRKWHIHRIREEIDKQNAAEKAAVNKAKSNKGKI